jgi:hypothetical protein
MNEERFTQGAFNWIKSVLYSLLKLSYCKFGKMKLIQLFLVVIKNQCQLQLPTILV